MATKKLEEFQIKTAEEIRDDILRGIKNSLIKRGITNPLVAEGSQYHIDATNLSQQIYLATQSFELKADEQMPDTASGEALYRQARVLGLALKAAGGSTGQMIFDCSIDTPVAVVQGALLSDSSGLTYEVTIGGAFSDEDLIDINSVDTGESTNLAAGSILRWASPPAFANSTAEIATGGLIGGIDSETDENLRTRLLDRIRNPPGGGNWSQLALAAEDSSSAVQKAFVYPACNGPSTVHVAVTGNPTATNKTREVNSLIVSGKVASAIQEVMPEYAELVVTTVQDYPTSVSMGLSIPDATTAAIPGPGGGWTDAQPFPVYASLGYTGVTAVTNSTRITIQSTLPPVAGTSRIVWVSQDDWIVRKATVLSYTGSTPSFDCVIDTPFVSGNGILIVPGNWVMPDAENIETYVEAILTVFANLGPGQKTASSNLLPRASRRPLVGQSWVSDLDLSVTKFIENTGDEVVQAVYLYKSISSPPLPSLITDGPHILTPSNIGFYPNS